MFEKNGGTAAILLLLQKNGWTWLNPLWYQKIGLVRFWKKLTNLYNQLQRDGYKT